MDSTFQRFVEDFFTRLLCVAINNPLHIEEQSCILKSNVETIGADAEGDGPLLPGGPGEREASRLSRARGRKS